MIQTPAMRTNVVRIVGAVHQVVKRGYSLRRHGGQRNGRLRIVQRSSSQQTRDRDLPVGHIQMHFVADPALLVFATALFHAQAAVAWKLGQHLRQILAALAWQASSAERCFA